MTVSDTAVEQIESSSDILKGERRKKKGREMKRMEEWER